MLLENDVINGGSIQETVRKISVRNERKYRLVIVI
jgi:hypothetical protein